MRKRFDYRKIPDYTKPSKSWVKRPLLQVTLFNGAKHQVVISLVDSGADVFLFHSSIADRLGIDMKSEKPVSIDGIASGQPIEAYFHTVQLQVQDFPDKIEIQVGFTESDGVDGLLGQVGFFENYKITFERYRGCFWVEDRLS
ncbi:MAG: hypothetical protein AUG51_22360 [Acidobacteria bacterium 13_1_20CM_3_53_8]|nr:MAG: hypothetical protein AUG51_22360 [Acidobacteria bacterium 13_1_20CM_3_53_8]